MAEYVQKLTGYRGEVVFFTDDPARHPKALHHYPDGVLYVCDGYVVAAGDFETLAPNYPRASIVDHRGGMIVPGFVDTHVHYPQTEMIGAYGEQLLAWLETYTFPTEAKFADSDYAAAAAERFLSLLVAHGTTTALVFATVHPASVDAFFERALIRNMRMISGKVLMDCHAPPALRDTPESAYDDSLALIKRWHGNGRLRYAVTPRFAPTSTDAQLAVAGRLLAEYPDLYLHTHLAENHQEVAWVASLFPDSRSYLDVYRQHGLLTSRSVFAHGIHLDTQDRDALRQHDSAIAFCPCSNLFLGSGLFDMDAARRHSLKVGLGTDVGAGTSLSLLATMCDAYKVTQLRKVYADVPDDVAPLTPQENLYLATLGGARALSVEDCIGSFLPGREADFIVLDPTATPIMAQRMQHAVTLDERLFAVMVLGDDRVVAHTYIMGECVK